MANLYFPLRITADAFEALSNDAQEEIRRVLQPQPNAAAGGGAAAAPVVPRLGLYRCNALGGDLPDPGEMAPLPHPRFRDEADDGADSPRTLIAPDPDDAEGPEQAPATPPARGAALGGGAAPPGAPARIYRNQGCAMHDGVYDAAGRHLLGHSTEAGGIQPRCHCPPAAAAGPGVYPPIWARQLRVDTAVAAAEGGRNSPARRLSFSDAGI